MKRASKGYTGMNIQLFPTMIVQGLESVVPQPRSPTQALVTDKAASTGVDVRYGGSITTVTGLVAGQGSGQYDTSRIDGSMYNIVQESGELGDRLANQVKSSQARRRAKIVLSDDEEDLEDPSKQGRKISKIYQDPTISLVQHDAEIQERQEHEHDEEFDFDLNATKEVSTAKPFSTASVIVTTAIVSTAKDKGKGIMEESEPIQTKTKLTAEGELVQESSKRQKTKESSESAEESKDEEEELSQEKLQQMMIILLEQGMNVEALKTKEDLVMLWSLVKERFNSTELTNDKEIEISVELKRLFKPDTVHHVSTKEGIDIYMLVEKEYPLSRGTLTLMLACSFMLCDLDFEPLSLSLSFRPSCDLVSLANILILCLILKDSNQSLRKSSVLPYLLKEQLLKPALNLTVHCCGLEFRVLNGYDQKSFDEERCLNCVVQMSFDV
ncbi:hypothetical protein Tco_1229427 [Tanacetum coccineum]